MYKFMKPVRYQPMGKKFMHGKTYARYISRECNQNARGGKKVKHPISVKNQRHLNRV